MLPPKSGDGWQIPRMVEEGVTAALRNTLQDPTMQELMIRLIVEAISRYDNASDAE